MNPLSIALMLKIYGAYSEQQKQIVGSRISTTEMDSLKLLISPKTSLVEFVSQFRLLLAKQIDDRWTIDKAKSSPYGRPVILHFDEVGGLDDPELMAHMKCKEPRDVFYKFWATLDDVLKQTNCFVYVSGKDSSMDLVGHPGASRGKSSGYVERLLLEPLSVKHVMQMMSLPQPDGALKREALCRSVFGIDATALREDSLEYKLMTNLAELLVHITGGLPRALLYAFMWLKEHVGSAVLLAAFLTDHVKVSCFHLTSLFPV